MIGCGAMRVSREPTPARDPLLWAALGLGLGLRLGLLLRYPATQGLGDEVIHYGMALLTAHVGPDVLGQWAPLYDLLLAGVFRVAGPDPFAAKLVQVGISTACVALVYALARSAGSLRAGRIAAVLCAVDPTLIAFSHYLFSETLFVALLLGAACALFPRGGTRRRRDLAAAGVLFGLATLTRSAVLAFLPIWWAAARLRGRRTEARQALQVLLVALAVVLPWTLRNAVKYHGLLLVDGTLGRTAWFAFSEIEFNQDHGYNTLALPRERRQCPPGRAPGLGALPSVDEALALLPPESRGLFGHLDRAAALALTLRFARADLVAYQRCELRHALDFALRRPGTVAGHALRRLYAFWGPNSFLLRAIARGVYPDGPLAPSRYRVWRNAVVAWHVGLLAGAILLLGRSRLPPAIGWMLGFAAYYTALHLLAVAHSRYRLPLMPFVTIAAALWVAEPRWPASRGRAAAVAAALAAAVALCAHYAWVRLP
jgi:4-amino-4-deoxy-L-arabinose transferase-like glycosyltransferase